MGVLRSRDWNVPTGALFLLGEDLPQSEDSREFGPVPSGRVIGTAKLIYFSSGPQGVRWDRVGTAL